MADLSLWYMGVIVNKVEKLQKEKEAITAHNW